MADSGNFVGPRIDPSGKHIVVERALGSAEARSSDIWVFDLGSGAMSRLTSDSVSMRPEWIPDSRHIAVVKRVPDASGYAAAVVLPWDGTAAPQRLLDDAGEISIARRGKYLAIRRGSTATKDIHIAQIYSANAVARL